MGEAQVKFVQKHFFIKQWLIYVLLLMNMFNTHNTCTNNLFGQFVGRQNKKQHFDFQDLGGSEIYFVVVRQINIRVNRFC